MKIGPSLAREGATMGRKEQSGTERSRSGNGANFGFQEKLWGSHRPPLHEPLITPYLAT